MLVNDKEPTGTGCATSFLSLPGHYSHPIHLSGGAFSPMALKIQHTLQNSLRTFNNQEAKFSKVF